MTAELRAELDRIEQYLMGPDGANLGRILSMLRGPDNQMGIMKRRMTNHIRRAAFPVLAAKDDITGSTPGSAGFDMWDLKTDGEPFDTSRRDDYENEFHFCNHAKYAGMVLGLKDIEEQQ